MNRLASASALWFILSGFAAPGAGAPSPNPDELTSQASVLEKKDDFHGAALALERALALRPRDPVIEQELARAYEELGQSEKAAALNEALVKVRPADYGLRVSLAQDYVNLGQFKEARKQFAAARKIDGKAREAYIQEGYADFQAGDYAAADKAFSAFISADDSNPLAYHHMGAYLKMRGRLPEAERYIRQALARLEAATGNSLEDRAHSLIFLGLIQSQEGRSAAAEATFKRGVEVSKPLADQSYTATMWTFLGDLYAKEGKSQAAENAFVAAISACSPENECYHSAAHAGALSGLASFYAGQGRKKDAEETAGRLWDFYRRAGRIPAMSFGLHVDALAKTAAAYSSVGDDAQAESIYRFVLSFSQISKLARFPAVVFPLAELETRAGRTSQAKSLYGGLLSYYRGRHDPDRRAMIEEVRKRLRGLNAR